LAADSEGPVSNVVNIFGSEPKQSQEEFVARRRNGNGLTTDHYRRLLAELKLRPPSQRAYLRKLLSQAISTGRPTHFPVITHAVFDPVSPS
jgi:hypothetical protein